MTAMATSMLPVLVSDLRWASGLAALPINTCTHLTQNMAHGAGRAGDKDMLNSGSKQGQRSNGDLVSKNAQFVWDWLYIS